MFVLSKFSDLIRVKPQDFNKSTSDALEDEINTKYANKVVQNVGLCICLYDIHTIDEGLIKPGDGAVYIKVEFRLIVFRPFVGEILEGWISSCSEDGIRVKMEFFDDVFIPKEYLFEGSVFVPKEQAWVWRTEDNELYMDTNEKIRFRIEEEQFHDLLPRIAPSNPNLKPDEASEYSANQIPPYALIGSCQSDGVGLISWWE
ncbi:hypothetical protein NADFUDRAFT_45986 [Nadsonia fulvescens var. elongata DSM 6958]|uniref:DNA-directed RNA polymerase subunit n=1 Tax=Nadsonia fulvescens var. elongata DSM 6958 TaxID=857566 RepID=A0A1E3PMM4_9ASCO|nr:hypothetical protein NADFUDRAFT_45986 [Nadsonia fulvescens var. elongata DSM 6958]